MKMQIYFICFLAVFSVVNSITINGKSGDTRFKRSEADLEEGNKSNESTEQDYDCPTQAIECLKCYNEINEGLKKNICSFDFVAEVTLTGTEKCGEIIVNHKIKNDEGSFSSTKLTYSMANDCANCINMFNKTVTLMTSHENFDFMADGIRFDAKTIIINGESSIQDCSSLTSTQESIQESSKESSKESSANSTESSSDASPETTTGNIVEEAFTLSTDSQTTETQTMGAIFVTEAVSTESTTDLPNIDFNFNTIPTYSDMRRRVNEPPPPDNGRYIPIGQYNPGNGYNGGYSVPSVHSNGHSYNVPQYRFEYPHTQDEYSSPQYSPYHSPPGYLNTGYFNAESLQYGAGNPPAVNPNYYYSTQIRPNVGKRYRPSQLNPKPTYYPKQVPNNYNFPNNYIHQQNYMPQNRGPNYPVPVHNNPYNMQFLPQFNRTYGSPQYSPFASNVPQYTNYQSRPYFVNYTQPQNPMSLNYNIPQPNYNLQPNYTTNYQSPVYTRPSPVYNQKQPYTRLQNSYNNYSNNDLNSFPPNYNQNNYTQQMTGSNNYGYRPPYTQVNFQRQPYTNTYDNYMRPPNKYNNSHQNYSGYNSNQRIFSNNNNNNYRLNNSYNQQNYSNTGYGLQYTTGQQQSYGRQPNYNSQQMLPNYNQSLNSYNTEQQQPYYESLYNQNYSNNSNNNYKQHNYTNNANYGQQMGYNSQPNNADYNQQNNGYNANLYQSPPMAVNQYNQQQYQSNGSPGQYNRQPNYNPVSQQYQTQPINQNYANNYNQNNDYSKQTTTTQNYSNDSYGQQSENNYEDNSQSKRSFQPFIRHNNRKTQYMGQHAAYSMSDYVASSSDQISQILQPICTSIPASCPMCLSDVTEPSLIKIICDYKSIFKATLINNNKIPFDDQRNNTNSCQMVSIESIIKPKSLLTSKQFWWSMNSQCKCDQLSDTLVIVFATIGLESVRNDESLDNKFLILKHSFGSSDDVLRTLHLQKCQ